MGIHIQRQKRYSLFAIYAIAVLALLGGAIGYIGHLSAQALSVGGREEKLFTPTTKTPTFGAVGYTTRSDGSPIAVMVSGGYGARLNIIDIKANKNLATDVSIDPADTRAFIWGVETMSDRTVLISTNAKQLYGLNPDTLELTEYSNTTNSTNYAAVANVSDMFWGIVRDENDKVYIASYEPSGYGGRVLTFDYKTKVWGDLTGELQGDADYVRSVAYENGYVYAGTGAQNPSIYKINKDTGAVTKLDISHHLAPESTFVYEIVAQNGRLYTSTTNNTLCTTSCIFDATTGAYIDSIPTLTSGIYAKRPGYNDMIYYRTIVNGEICLTQYDALTKTTKDMICSADLGSVVSHASWISATMYASINPTTGSVSLYDTTTGQITKTSTPIYTSPRPIQAITEGKNGNIYTSWYMPSDSIVEFNTATPTQYGHVGIANYQPEGLGKNGDWIVYGGYSGGVIGSVNPETGVRRPVRVIGQDQDRPYAILDIEGTDKVAVGSVPEYGNLGGALTIYNATTNTIENVYHASNMPMASGIAADALKDLAPVSFAYKNNKLYVGTTIRGGLGIHPTRTEASLFVFDLTTRTVEKVTVPVPGHAAVSALRFADDGKLYGVTGSTIFEINPTTLAVVRSLDLGLYAGSLHPGTLYDKNGTLYADVSGALYEINASNFSDNRKLASGDHAVLASDGNLYYSRLSTIYRWVTEDLVDPLISITTPKTGTTADKSLTITATASDNKAVTKVEFYQGTTKLGEDTTANPYTFTWDTTKVAEGTYAITAKAYDAAGNVKASAPISITVQHPDTTAPTVSLTAPTSGATIDKSATLTATASDDKAVTKVEFYQGTTKLGEDTTANPYTFTWDTTKVAEGTYAITAKAYDAAGNVKASAAVSVTINHPVLLVDLAQHKTPYDPTVSAAKLAVKAGGTCSDITSSRVLAPNTVTAPANVTILGGIGFTLKCTTVGGQSEVIVSLGKTYTDTTPLRIYKHTDNVLKDITTNVIIQTTNGVTTVRYIVKDGATHDDDNVTNGTIVDPLYIGLADPTPTPTDPPATTEPTPTPDPTAPTENTDGNVLAATGSNTTLLQYIGGGIGLVGMIALVGRVVGRRP